MNLNYNYKLYIKHLFSSVKMLLIISIALITIFSRENLLAQDAGKETPKVRIGLGGSYGYYSAINRYGNIDWEPGYGYGGGLVFENMFTNTFGLHSGIWFTQCTLKAEFPDNGGTTKEKHKFKSNIITIPFYLITSLGSGFITLNILTGLNFSYIAQSYMTPGTNGQQNENIQKYLGWGQIGAGGGIELLFRITKFTRLFISCVGEYYFTRLIEGGNDTGDYLYNANIRAGIMLCTF